MDNVRQEFSAGCAVTPQLVRDELARNVSQAFRSLTKEAFGSALVPVLLHKDVQHITILIDGAPEVMPLTADCDEDLVHEPGIAQTPLAASKTSGEDAAELETPLADGLVAHNGAPFRQQVLDVSETEAKSVVEPDSVGNDLRRIAVARIGIPRRVHAPTISASLLPPST